MGLAVEWRQSFLGLKIKEVVFLGFWRPSLSSFLQALGHMTREKAHNALQLLGLEGLSHLVNVDSHQHLRPTTQIVINRPEGQHGQDVSLRVHLCHQVKVTSSHTTPSKPHGFFPSVLLEISGRTCHTVDEGQLPPHT